MRLSWHSLTQSHFCLPIYLVSFDFDFLYNTVNPIENTDESVYQFVSSPDYSWYTNWTSPKTYIHTSLCDTKTALLHLLPHRLYSYRTIGRNILLILNYLLEDL